LVAQPWTYKKIGGPSKLPKDFPPSQITPAHPSSYIPLCHMTTHVRYYISCHMILHHMTTHDITSQVLWHHMSRDNTCQILHLMSHDIASHDNTHDITSQVLWHHMSRDNTCQILHLISHDITSHVTWQHILHHMSGSTSRITWYCITWQHRWHMTLHRMSHDNTYYITCHMIAHGVLTDSVLKPLILFCDWRSSIKESPRWTRAFTTFQFIIYCRKADFQFSHEAPRSSLRVMHEHFHPIPMLNSSF
jgi:hypothetical protein